jgi:uncharacterized repeat protein (TIGR01451 family)
MDTTTRSRGARHWPLIVPALALALLLPALAVYAGPPSAPALGITPTPTFTVTPPVTATPPPERLPVDPVITKRSDKQTAELGEEVVFTIEATNKGEKAAVGVLVRDEISEWLEILGATTTQGTVSIDGQTVTVDVGVIGPQYVVQIVIRTRVREETPAPIEIENLAVLHSPNGGERRTPPVIVRVPSYLPETGRQHELWPLLLLFGLVAIGSGLWRRRIAQQVDEAGQEGG